MFSSFFVPIGRKVIRHSLVQGLAALQIRRELCDLARNHRGHVVPNVTVGCGRDLEGRANQLAEKSDPTDGPGTLSEWTEFHETIQQLPDEERDIFDLVYYHGLGQAQAAEILGVSLRTVKRRWLKARMRVFDAFHRPTTQS